MSLPQRKKTPEEIAKLREELGIPGGPTAAPQTSSPAAPEPTPTEPSEPPADELPPAEAEELPPASAEETPSPVAEAPQPVVEYYEPEHPSGAKPVRSLRKSERIPSSRPISTSTSSSLPTQRRTEKELSMLRRSQPITTAPVAHLIALTAHPFIVGLGYFLVLGAAALPFLDRWFMELGIPYIVLAVMCVGGFFISGFIFLKKKRSLHHAGFIAMIALLVMVFAALYYFPNLRNAS